MLSAETATLLFSFLLEYIESSGRVCDHNLYQGGDRLPPGSGTGSGSVQMAQQSVMHELMRAFAQLLADCGQHLDAKSQQTLTVLLPFCDPQCIDIDCRFAAIDALGNFFKSLNNTSAGPPSVSSSFSPSAALAIPAGHSGGASSGSSGGDSSTSASSGKISRNTLGSTSLRILPPPSAGHEDSEFAYARSNVDATLLRCLHVVVSNLHASVAQSSLPAPAASSSSPPSSFCPVSAGLALQGGILDRIFISVLRTLIALYAYLHTLNLNLDMDSCPHLPQQQEQGAAPPSEPRLYHQQGTERSRRQAQAYVPEVLGDVQRILHSAHQLLQIEGKRDRGRRDRGRGEEGAALASALDGLQREGGSVSKLSVSVATGDHDSTVRFLHHSLQLVATLFLFEQPGACRREGERDELSC
jgi:hypothetical protein